VDAVTGDDTEAHPRMNMLSTADSGDGRPRSNTQSQSQAASEDAEIGSTIHGGDVALDPGPAYSAADKVHLDGSDSQEMQALWQPGASPESLPGPPEEVGSPLSPLATCDIVSHAAQFSSPSPRSDADLRSPQASDPLRPAQHVIEARGSDHADELVDSGDLLAVARVRAGMRTEAVLRRALGCHIENMSTEDVLCAVMHRRVKELTARCRASGIGALGRVPSSGLSLHEAPSTSHALPPAVLLEAQEEAREYMLGHTLGVHTWKELCSLMYVCHLREHMLSSPLLLEQLEVATLAVRSLRLSQACLENSVLLARVMVHLAPLSHDRQKGGSDVLSCAMVSSAWRDVAQSDQVWCGLGLDRNQYSSSAAVNEESIWLFHHESSCCLCPKLWKALSACIGNMTRSSEHEMGHAHGENADLF